MRILPRDGVLGTSIPFHTSLDRFLPITPHQGFLMSTHPDYLEQKSWALGHTEYSLVEHGPPGNRAHSFRVVTRKQVEVTLPDWARHLFRPKNVITQQENWRPPLPDGTRIIDIRVRVARVPVRIRGTATLSPLGTVGHRLDIDCTTVSRLPVIGHRLAEFVATQMSRTMEGEGDFAVQYAQRDWDSAHPG